MAVGGGEVCNLPEGDAPQPIGPQISATCVGRAVVRVLLCVVLTAICEPQQPYTCVRVSVCVCAVVQFASPDNRYGNR